MSELLSFSSIKLIQEKSTHVDLTRFDYTAVLFGKRHPAICHSGSPEARAVLGHQASQLAPVSSCSSVTVCAVNGHSDALTWIVNSIRDDHVFTGNILFGSVMTPEAAEFANSLRIDSVIMHDEEITFSEILEVSSVSKLPIIVIGKLTGSECIKALVAGATLVITSDLSVNPQTTLSAAMLNHNVYCTQDLTAAKWRVIS